MKNKQSKLILHIIYLSVIVAYILVLRVLRIGCPSRFFFKISCPGCGGTRAILSLLRLDIKAYLYYHPLAVPLCVAIWLMLHIRLFKRTKMVTAIAFTILVANIIYFVWRLMNSLIP